MNILVFNKLTKPIYEGGLTIDCAPRGQFLVEVRRPDGTIRRPFGDNLIQNTFLDQWRNEHLNPSTVRAECKGWNNGATSDSQMNTWTDFFYGARSSIAIGSGSATASASNTGLASPIRHDSSPHASGNGITWSQSTGDTVYTIKEEFPAETGSVTYREAGIRLEPLSTSTTGGINGMAHNSGLSRLMNRVVFPANVTLNSGEALILTIVVTIPTLASTNGKTITISAQNNMNISGVLRLYSPQNNIVGGTVTGGGAITNTRTHTALTISRNLLCAMNTSTTAGTLGSLLSGGTNSTEATSVITWTSGQSYIDYGFTFGANIPTSNFTFGQLRLRPSGVDAGYQLLLDSTMTKATAGILAFTMRLSL
jgi:hypothetical protein